MTDELIKQYNTGKSRISDVMINPARDVSYELEGTQFVWDAKKNHTNYEKHKITFEEAATVFIDIDTEYLEDKKHMEDDDRFIAIGFSANEGILTVCHCLRDNLIIRIISARKATKPERKKFASMKLGDTF